MAGPSDRTRRWLATLGNPETLTRSLAAGTIELRAQSGDAAAEIALAMTATLLLRLDEAAPVLAIDVSEARTVGLPRLGDGDLVDALAAEHEGFASLARLHRGPPSCKPVLRLLFGAADGDADGLVIDTRRWQVAVGHQLPGDPGNPLAAAYAGVLAAAEALKVLLARAGIRHRRIRPWTGTISLWDHALDSSDPGPAITRSLDLDDVTFIGCGGICAATVWALALLPLTGAPRAVDGDTLDDTNLNRQIIAGHRDLGSPKPDLVAAVLDAAGASAVPILEPWQELSAELRRSCDTGVISVDHDPTRRVVQLDLPRLLLNAGNADTGLYRVTRHDFLDGACLACMSRGDERSSGPVESAARRLGLPLAELQLLVDADVPLPVDLLARAAITEDERDRLSGKRARVALGIVCGEFAPAPDQPALSTPALSAAPGVLLAAELVKERLGGASSLGEHGNHLAASILAGPHARWATRRAKRPGCECGDEIYRSYYSNRWAGARSSVHTLR
jgi:hypothetical protein